MGAGKQEAAPPQAGGDGGEAAEQPPQPVVLRMELHCAGCAKKVRKSIHHMPGVVSVVADPAANTVVVAGTADAAALKARIESKTKKPVQILSAGGAAPSSKPPPAANPDKQQQQQGGGGGEEKMKSPDKGGGGADNKDKAGGSSVAKEGKKQPPQETKPVEEAPTPTTALLRIRLHCDSCADRIRRRICKIKGVKDVVVEGDGVKDEVKVVGTMDVPAMLAYLNDKLNRAVELAAPPGSSKGATKEAKGGDDGHVKEDKAHKAGDKGKGIDSVAGPSMASAAASMAAPPGPSTHHVSPYGYGHVAYPPQAPPPGYYSNGYYGGGGNADGGYYQQQPSSDAGGYFQQQPSSGYYQQQQQARGGGYYDEQPRGGYYDEPPRGGGGGGYYGQQQPGGGYEQNRPAYPFDTAPAPNMFSDENPNSCSLM